MPNAQKWDRLDCETSRAFEAFNVYLNLGPSRSLPQVAKALGRVVSGINRWSARYDWVARSMAYDAYRESELRRLREAETNNSEIREYRDRAKREARAVGRVGLEAIRKIALRLQGLDPDKIPVNVLPSIMRSATVMLDYALNAEAQAIGATELLAMLDELPELEAPEAVSID